MPVRNAQLSPWAGKTTTSSSPVKPVASPPAAAAVIRSTPQIWPKRVAKSGMDPSTMALSAIPTWAREKHKPTFWTATAPARMTICRMWVGRANRRPSSRTDAVIATAALRLVRVAAAAQPKPSTTPQTRVMAKPHSTDSAACAGQLRLGMRNLP